MTMLAEPPAPATAPGRISVRDYFSAQQEHFSKADAQTIGPELRRLAEAGKTRLGDVVDAARPEESLLNRYFTWDDRLAAERFRQLEAGRMTRAIIVRTVDGGEERQAPAFRPIAVKVIPAPVALPTVLPLAAPTVARERTPSTAPRKARVAPVRTASAPKVRETRQEWCDRLTEEALSWLDRFEREFGGQRDVASFGYVFEPVFSAIDEAKERARER